MLRQGHLGQGQAIAVLKFFFRPRGGTPRMDPKWEVYEIGTWEQIDLMVTFEHLDQVGNWDQRVAHIVTSSMIVVTNPVTFQS